MNNSEQYRKECEARQVLKMDYDKRQDYYKGVLSNRKQKGLDELKAEVATQEANQVLKLDYEARQEYYRNIQANIGQDAVETLVSAVKRQRKLLEKGVEIS